MKRCEEVKDYHREVSPPRLATLLALSSRQAPRFSSSTGTDPPHSHSQDQHKTHMALLTHTTGLDAAVQS